MPAEKMQFSGKNFQKLILLRPFLVFSFKFLPGGQKKWVIYYNRWYITIGSISVAGSLFVILNTIIILFLKANFFGKRSVKFDF